jgi:hypothetical protein
LNQLVESRGLERVSGTPRDKFLGRHDTFSRRIICDSLPYIGEALKERPKATLLAKLHELHSISSG